MIIVGGSVYRGRLFCRQTFDRRPVWIGSSLAAVRIDRLIRFNSTALQSALSLLVVCALFFCLFVLVCLFFSFLFFSLLLEPNAICYSILNWCAQCVRMVLTFPSEVRANQHSTLLFSSRLTNTPSYMLFKNQSYWYIIYLFILFFFLHLSTSVCLSIIENRSTFEFGFISLDGHSSLYVLKNWSCSYAPSNLPE